jgi:hypothetical protein
MSSAVQSRPWSVHRLPRADGKTFLVTGGNAGIGYFVAEQLAGTGATVVLGSRDAARAEAAMASIRSRVPDARVRHLRLDLADLSSLRACVDALEVDRLDAVVHNAGVLIEEPERRETADGNEWRLDLADLQSTREYQPKRTYSRSKLAQMLFGFELDRRLRAAASTVSSVVTHPGGALDSLTPERADVHRRTTGERLRGLPAGLLVQGKEHAAWPAVRAVLDPSVSGGQLWGPRVFGLRGLPALEPVRDALADQDVAARLWEASRDLTGVDPTFRPA